MKVFLILAIILLLPSLGFFYYLFRPLRIVPKPAAFQCIPIQDGKLEAFTPNPNHIFGMGLVYSKHIEETASNFSIVEPPPIFIKDKQSLASHNSEVKTPNSLDLFQALLKYEPSLESEEGLVNNKDLPPLLDYEVELGFVLLADIKKEDLYKKEFIPPIGFFLANDISARTIAVFGEGRQDKAEYWGISKSFPNFLPVSSQVWIPSHGLPNGIPCIRIQTFVNGIERQNEVTVNMIYTPKEMLQFISEKYKNIPLKKNDMVIMGTPGGVAMSTPRWMVRISDLIGLNRFQKLKIVLRKDRTNFLKSGDKVLIRGEGFGEVENTIVN
ncbi:MAG TPA: fumarylacetoacetate hydrolase family protein [Leptospiraceae bacterium]|nr:fumarylacetoacetate hydrolase family protein [Leptospiraceae bacterium]HMW07603.1 fumarylacetoacetate hydrolase family protein [Leptospiraceae bacterium]HMX33019.1 fumarylacetoacetate hydrolase family protein [Leptospiraceae bacterium]HMY33182.1 fumarylacetoacetate hydrolase family protein [Leptospiraceae bacterium]HMZ66361.1 fumarylacetoacetate hydrolase family protein [Leptospiraceae bacterium]